MRPLVLLSALAILSAPVAAQVSETPVPFDSAGRITSVNPALATRLGLTQPAWPVTGQFIEARLYRVSSGGHTLTVTRSGGGVDRFSLDDTQAALLRVAFAEGINRAGRVVVEDAQSVISEPARGPFVRDQMLLASIIYGPALASLTNDGAMGTGVYMLSIGGTFFGLNEFAGRRSITKAQNSLTTDGALRGWAAMGLATTMVGAHLSEDATAMTALVGGIGGSIIGYHRGSHLTNSEAQSAMTASTLGAVGVVGAATTLGLIGEDDGDEKLASAALLAGGVAGYVMGPRYPRAAGYTVTAGDVQLVRLGAVLGTMAAFTPFSEMEDIGLKTGAGILTAGWVGGALLADRIAAKPFNHSAGDSRMIYLGAVGGALMGSALPTMARSESALMWMSTITGGAIIGAVATHKRMDPAREGSVLRTNGSDANSAKVQLIPENVLLAATGQRGNHTLLRVRF
jgi:hypothetical protein